MRPVVIDAGPALNFLSSGHGRILIGVVGKGLCAPETVDNEVRRKSATDPRMTAVASNWQKLIAAGRLQVLSDDPTPELQAASAIVLGHSVPLHIRQQQAKDLGETMVMIHAMAKAMAGVDVSIIIDDQRGAQEASRMRRTLERSRRAGKPYGVVELHSTETVLVAAVQLGLIPDRATLKDVYSRLRSFDDGLTCIEQTGLLSDSVWTARIG